MVNLHSTGEAVWRIMTHSCFPPFTEEQCLESADSFEKDFLNCIEAMDGKHIRIIKPNDSGWLPLLQL
jgi:hypothetical protein